MIASCVAFRPDLSVVAVIITFALSLVTESGITLLDKRKLDTLALRKRDGWSLTITNNEDVRDSGGERVTLGVLDVGNVIGTLVLLDGLEDTNSTNVVSSGQHDSGTVGELDDGADLTSGEVDLDGVVETNVWVRESEGSAIMGSNVWDLLLVDGLTSDLAELEAGLSGVDLVGLESTLDVVEDSEVLVGSLDRDNVHVAKRESWVTSDLTVDLDETLLVLDNLSGFLSVQSVFKSLLKENIERNALPKLVRTGRWSGTVNTLELAKIPLLGSSDSLHNLSLSFVTLKRCVRNMQHYLPFENNKQTLLIPF